MAITTLPYPNMDFVPLDILTAEELDQIVANYTAINNANIGTNSISNSAITTAKVASKAITEDKMQKNIITVKSGSSTETTYDSESYLPLTLVVSNVGTKLSLSNNAIVIGSGVSKVKVSSSVFASYGGGTGYLWTKIRKNNADTGASAIANFVDAFNTASITPYVLSVSSGDTIKLFMDSTKQKVRNSESWLTVEVIE